MKSTRTLKAAGLVLIAVVLGLLTVQGSYALWNKAATSDAGTIQAADFRIGLTDAISARATNMTLEDGTAATLSLSTTPAGVVLPGQSTYAGVQVGNVTNASGDGSITCACGSAAMRRNSSIVVSPFRTSASPDSHSEMQPPAFAASTSDSVDAPAATRRSNSGVVTRISAMARRPR